MFQCKIFSSQTFLFDTRICYVFSELRSSLNRSACTLVGGGGYYVSLVYSGVLEHGKSSRSLENSCVANQLPNNAEYDGGFCHLI